MTHRVDLLHGGDNTEFGAGQLLDNSGNGLRVGGEADILVKDGLTAHQRAVLQMSVDTDALAETLGHELFGLHVDELVFEGGAACVDNKNFH